MKIRGAGGVIPMIAVISCVMTMIPGDNDVTTPNGRVYGNQ